MLKKLLLLTAALCSIAPATAGSLISEESKHLASCEGIYIFLAHLSQMQNNEGLAKNLLYRASRVYAANVFMYFSKGDVPDETLAQWKAVRRVEKPSLDANPQLAIYRASECDKTVEQSIRRIRNENKKVWAGLSYDEFQQTIFNQSMTSMGIR